MSFYRKQSLLGFALLLLTACGSSGGSSTTASDCTGDNVTTACTSSYHLHFDASDQMTGKSTFTLTVHDHTHSDAPVSGATVSLLPWMRMATMNHTSIVDSVVDNGDGTYTCVVYYLMPSSMGGQSMGTWDMGVTVNGETATFTPLEVGMSMMETVKVTLSNSSDQYSNMGTPSTRSWILFKDSVSSSGTMSVLVSTIESMSNFPKVGTGSTLTDANSASWTVNSLVVQLSTDKATWHTATEDSQHAATHHSTAENLGHFTVTGLTGLTDGTASNVYVKLTVNGNVYTTSGGASDGTNDYQTFVVIPGGGMSM